MDQPTKQSALPDTEGVDVTRSPVRHENAQNTGCGRRQTLWQWLMIFAVGLSLVNILILYILHFEHRPFSSSKTTSISIKNKDGNLLSATTQKVPNKNTGLSYNSKGQINAGAGTTVYLKAGAFDATAVLKYIYSAPINPTAPSDTILLSYYKDKAYLTTATVSNDNKLTINEPKNSVDARQIRGLATLSSSLAVAEIVDPAVSDIYYGVVSISSSNDITLDKSNLVKATSGSYLNTLARLTDTAFVTAYYDSYTTTPQLQYVTIGSVNNGKIEMSSSPLTFGNPSVLGSADTVYSIPVGVKLNNNPAFALPWYTSYSDNTTTGYLCVLVGASDNSGNPTKKYETCSKKYNPGYRADNAIAISETKFAIAFYDKKNNHALTLLIAEVTNTAVIFGGDVVVPGTDNGAFNFGAGYSWSPSASLTLLDNNRIAVVFHDKANDGTPSTAVFEIFSNSRLSLVSPVVPYTFNFVGMSTTPSKTSYGTVLNAQAFNGGRYFAGFLGPMGTTAQSQASVVTSANPAIGLVSDKSGSKINVALGGTYGGLDDLTVGYTYYVTGTGDIRGCDASKNAVGQGAVLIGDNELIVSNDARIGIATSDDTLLLLPGVAPSA